MAQNRARLQFSKRDDLGDVITAVFLAAHSGSPRRGVPGKSRYQSPAWTHVPGSRTARTASPIAADRGRLLSVTTPPPSPHLNHVPAPPEYPRPWTTL